MEDIWRDLTHRIDAHMFPERVCGITAYDDPKLLGQKIAIPRRRRRGNSPETVFDAGRRPTQFGHVWGVVAEVLTVDHALGTRVV